MTAALLKHMLYLIATVASVAILFLSVNLPQGVWLLAPALLFLNVSLETSLWQRSAMIIFTGSIAVIGILLGSLLAPYLAAQAIFLILVIGACTYFAALYQHYAYALFAVSFLVLLSIHGDNGYEPALVRAEITAIGVIVVLAAQLVLLPFAAANEYQRCKVLVFKSLGDLVTEIFSCLTSPAYPENIYLFERRVHVQTTDCLSKMAALAQRARAAGVNSETVYNDVLSIFEILMDLSQIRWRVSDHTIFRLCSIELSEIDTSMTATLNAFPHVGKPAELEKCIVAFERSINRLEDNLEHIVKVAAREPVVFILFLSALKALLAHGKKMAEIEFLDVAEAIS